MIIFFFVDANLLQVHYLNDHFVLVAAEVIADGHTNGHLSSSLHPLNNYYVNTPTGKRRQFSNHSLLILSLFLNESIRVGPHYRLF